MTYIDVAASFNVSKSSKPSEDAFAFNLSRGLAAISDGVSNSFFSSIWSRLLVERFCQTEDQDLNDLFALKNVNNWLRPIQDLWLHEVKYLLDHHDFDPEISNQLPQKKPAAATFIGVQFISGLTGVRWRALIIGDSILIHVRDKKLVRSCLITKAEQFVQHTQSLGSYPGESKLPTVVEGEYLSGDQFILATDAMGKWLLQLYTSNERLFATVLENLVKIQEPVQFEKFVTDLRQDEEYHLDWDDTCILIINPEPVGIPVQLPVDAAPPFALSEPVSMQIPDLIPISQKRWLWVSWAGIVVIALGAVIFIGYRFWPIGVWQGGMPTKTPTSPIATTIVPHQTKQEPATATITATYTPTLHLTPTIADTITPTLSETPTATVTSTSTITANSTSTITPTSTSTITASATNILPPASNVLLTTPPTRTGR